MHRKEGKVDANEEASEVYFGEDGIISKSNNLT